MKHANLKTFESIGRIFIKTNADKIRQMTDEEMARYLFDYMVSLTKPENVRTYSEILEWLRKPLES